MNLTTIATIAGITLTTSLGLPEEKIPTYNNEAKNTYEMTQLQDAPDMHLMGADDSHKQLVEYLTNGKPTVLNFWATWCPPCQKEMPDLETFAQKYDGKVNVLAVSDEKLRTIKSYVAKKGFDDIEFFQRIANPYNIRAIPTTYVIDTQGDIVYRQEGEATFNNDNIEKTIVALLEE